MKKNRDGIWCLSWITNTSKSYQNTVRIYWAGGGGGSVKDFYKDIHIGVWFLSIRQNDH